MRNVSLLVKIFGVLAFGAIVPAAFGLSAEDAYIKSYAGRTDIPVPIKIVAPHADESMIGAKALVEFLVDPAGEPEQIRVIDSTDFNFGWAVRDAVAHWKFNPAISNGVPVSEKVILPVTVTE
jgi:TonB family protein